MSELAVVCDLDFHPDEPTIRAFKFARADVARIDDDAFVSRARYGDIVLHHYAWSDRWFKVNVTTDLAGHVVETAADGSAPAFAFNIDVATPMRRLGDDVFAVDLFGDLLVRTDCSYVVTGEDEIEPAAQAGQISSRERDAARQGLLELIELVEAGHLTTLLAQTAPLSRSAPSPAREVARIPIGDFPLLAAESRWTW
jgi:hypothetical protein